MKYTISGTFLGKPFKIRAIDANSFKDAREKVRNIIKFDEPKDWSDNTIFDFFNGLKKW